MRTVVVPAPNASVTSDAFYGASTVIIPCDAVEGRTEGVKTVVVQHTHVPGRSLVPANIAHDDDAPTVRTAPWVSGEAPGTVPEEYTISAKALADFADLLDHMERTGYRALEAVACLARDLAEEDK